METIYRGVEYSNDVESLYNSTFQEAPVVVLYNRPSKRCIEATCTIRQDGGYDFTFSAEQTGQMIPGIYTIEVYNNDKTKLYKRIENYAKAISVGVSPDNVLPQS